jgi:phosphoenolpyruvate carboxylase
MSTQHPDNVTTPFFAHNSVLAGEDEIQEAYYAFSHLGIEEQMWDCEGKEVDNFVVEKLLSRYERFFRSRRLGREVFLTLRVPNPEVERTEAKILLETLESIPRNFDIARAFYGEDVAPIFEVILPMTSSAASLNRIYYYYKNFVSGKAEKRFFEGDIKIKEWIGDFKPEEINVIPLIEDRESMLRSDAILEEYLADKRISAQRVFLARSDPAMNYGSLSAVLLNKIALQRLWRLAEKLSVELLPIIGVGSAPFRGNFKPTNVYNCLWEYPSVQTYTVQSAFKYDYPENLVREAIEEIKSKQRRQPRFVSEDKCLEIINKVSEEYAKLVKLLSPLINLVAKHVPARRRRKLHIGLFGYSREVGDVSLPRAIPFCAALYSIGLPPELLGLGALRERDLDFISDMYVNFEEDLRDALRYFNPEVEKLLPKDVWKRLNLSLVEHESDEAHVEITSRIIASIKAGRLENLEKDIVEAAWVRKFLG